MTDVAQHYDAPQPRIVQVRGRDGGTAFTEDVEVFEMVTDDLAACIEDILSLVAVTKAPAHKADITQDDSGAVQIGQTVVLGILATAKDSAYRVLARCTGKEPAFFGRLYQASNQALVAAAIAANPDFFLTLLRMFDLVPAAANQTTSGQTNAPVSDE